MPAATPARPPLFFPATLFMQPFPRASLREARPVNRVPSEGGPSVVWNLVHCPLPSPRAFGKWDAMMSSADGPALLFWPKKNETNPIPCLSPFFKNSYLNAGVQESTLRGSPSMQPSQNGARVGKTVSHTNEQACTYKICMGTTASYLLWHPSREN